MRISYRKEFKSILIDISDLKAFVGLVDDIRDKENKKSEYERDATFEISYKNGRTYTFKDSGDFINQIKDDLGSEKIRIYYHGNKTIIRFSYTGSRSNGGWSDVEITAEDKGELLKLQEDIVSFFKRNSFNWLIHNPLPIILICGSIYLSSVMILYFNSFINKSTTITIGSWFLVIPMMVNFIFSRFYPNLIIEDSSKSSGRAIIKDLKFLWIVIALPLIVNFISKYL